MASSDAGDGIIGNNSISAWSKDAQNIPTKQIIPQKISTADDIPTIPDVDDLADNLYKGLSIEKSVNTSTMYEELDSELLKQYSYSSLDGVNVTPLLKFIHPDVHVKEPDVPWTIDTLFTELAEYYKEGKK